jgi:hypothetical protein
MVLFAVLGAGLFAYDWANASPPAKPLATVLRHQVWGIGYFVVGCILASVLANWRKTLKGLLLPLTVTPFYLVGLVPRIASPMVEAWVLGLAGAAAGAAAGVATGWLFARWILSETPTPRVVMSGSVRLPVAFAMLIALFGGYSWATAWLANLDDAWALALFPITFTLLGGLVGRPLRGLLSALPLVPLQLVPLVASLTVGWEGGWICGVAGAAAGAAAGAVQGWLYNRWIMPEYAKRRERELARLGLENRP